MTQSKSKTKLKYIRLLDIVPGKVYLAWERASNTWRPATIVCDETHGWQRGWVKVSGIKRGQGFVEANFVEQGFAGTVITVTLEGDEFFFKPPSYLGYSPNLRECPEYWFTDEITRLQLIIDSHQRRIEQIKKAQHVYNLSPSTN